jgi:hypothetical protein
MTSQGVDLDGSLSDLPRSPADMDEESVPTGGAPEGRERGTAGAVGHRRCTTSGTPP